MVLYNTGDWFTLRPGINYRKYELYPMDWSLDNDLDRMTICGAPYGGPMAIVRDSKQFTKITGSATAKPIIQIFTSAGQLLSTINWKNGSLLKMGWSNAEELLCVQNDGVVLIYDLFGRFKHKFYISDEAKDTKVIDARLFPTPSGTGVAVMTTNFRVFLINNIRDPKTRQLPEMPKSQIEPTCWETIIEDRNTYCLVAREKELFKLRQGDSVCTLVNVPFERSFHSIVAMAVSYNHQYLALYTNRGTIWMGTTDLKTKLCEFDTGRGSEVLRQMEWIMDADSCRSSDAIALSFASLLMVVNVAGDSNCFTYDSAVFLFAEMDGVRILSAGCHEIVQRVPHCVHNIFSINSQAPSSWLFEAHKKFVERNHQANEYLCQSRENLPEAVDECIEAAGFEFDTDTQKGLIKSAYFGKSFIAQHDPDEYIRVCRILRVLNAVRDPNVGIPLTMKQFLHLKPDVLLDRLVFRKLYGLSVHIAKHLQLPESRILEDWANNKVINDKDDDEVARKIASKFRSPSAKGVSFCNIAAKAEELGRKKLALMLLEFESKSDRQVPLLLKLGENKKALQSATLSGDTDLVYTVLLQLKKSTPLAEFQLIIRKFPVAQNLYAKYCQHFSSSTMQEIYDQEDKHVALAEFALREGIEGNSVASALAAAGDEYKRGKHAIEAELCEDARKLIKAQQQLTDRYPLKGMTVHESIKRLLKLGDLKMAEKFRNEYKVPDRRFWWLRIQIMSEQYLWADLDKFSKAKKSPIGYEPFVEVCLQQNNVDEAKKYLPRCRDELKTKWLIRTGMLEEAVANAILFADINSLWTIHAAATNTMQAGFKEKVENCIAQLVAKK